MSVGLGHIDSDHEHSHAFNHANTSGCSLLFLLPKLLRRQGRPMAASCITGDDTGLVKRVGLSQGQELHRWGVQAAGVGVCRLSWGAGDDEGVCGAGMQTGAVRFWDTGADADSATYSATCEYAAPADSTPAAVVGLRAVGTRVVACDANALVRVWQWAAPTGGGGAADAPLISFQAGKRAAAAAVADDGARLAAGGREADLTVWDLERGEAAWLLPPSRARILPPRRALLVALGRLALPE